MTNRGFRFFEGECSPYPLAVFRIIFFGGLLIHLLPALLCLQDNYSSHALRVAGWNSWLFEHFTSFPSWSIFILSTTTILALLMGLMGCKVPLAAFVSAG